jgi:hypothetical protein
VRFFSTELKIKKAKLRGVESNGMLCSATELGLAEESEGLLELPSSAPTGEDIRQYLKLDDVLIDVDLTPNRGDCLSVAGPRSRNRRSDENGNCLLQQIDSVPQVFRMFFKVE